MTYRNKVVTAITAFVQVCVLALAISLGGPGIGAGASGQLSVSGSITDQHGSGVADVSVTATDPGGSTVTYGPVLSSATGAYQLNIDAPGIYDIHFSPPGGGGWSPIVQSNIAVLFDQTINIQLVPAPTAHTFSGIFRDAGGNPLSGVQVSLSSDIASGSSSLTSFTDVNGHFSITVQPDVWRLTVRVLNAPGLPQSVDITGSEFDLTSGDIVQDLQLPSKGMATLTVVVRDTAGNPLSGIRVDASPQSVALPLFSGDNSQASASAVSPLTDASGTTSAAFFDSSVFPVGGPNAVTAICANYNDGRKVCAPNAVTLNGNVTVTITMPVEHTFSGTFRDADGNPLAGAVIKLSSSRSILTPTSTTDASGHFLITVSPDTWTASISMKNLPGYPPDIAISGGSSLNLTTSDIVRDLQFPLKNMGTLTIIVQDAAGNPVPNVPVSASSSRNVSLSSGSTSSVLTTGAFPFTDASGASSALFFDGATFPLVGPSSKTTICARFSAGIGDVCSTTVLTLNSTATVIITKPASPHVLSGTFRDVDGNPIPNGLFNLSSNKAPFLVNFRTDINGHFAITMQPAVWTGSLTMPSTAGLPQTVIISGLSFNLINSDVTQDLRIPLHTAQLTVTIKDSLGNPVTNLSVSGSPSQISAPLFSGDTTSRITGIGSFPRTDAAGTATATFFDGTFFPAGSICGNFGGQLGQVCSASAVTLNGNTSIVLQQVPPAPSAPANLTAASPTQNPALTWGTVSGASSYNVYRDGVKIGTSNIASYTDTNAAEGSRAYYVTAVGTGGESSPSNSVIVSVDRTGPVITYAAAPGANGSGWNNSDVVLTFSCDDPSGVQSCPAQVTLSTDGADQTTIQSATDNAGNTASITTSPINIDKTAPTLDTTNWSANPKPLNQSATLTVPVVEALSGTTRGEYYIGDTDPGVGNGTAMSISGNSVQATFDTTLATGLYKITIRVQDAAGNWSLTSTDWLVVFDPAGPTDVAASKQFVPSAANGDVLPGMPDSNNNKAELGFDILRTNTGAAGPNSLLTLSYATGRACNSPHPENCHTTSFTANTITPNGIDWLTVTGPQNSVGTFAGTGSLVVDGTTTSNPFKVITTDGDRTVPATGDTVTIYIFASGTNPNVNNPEAAALYKLHVAANGNWVTIQ